MNELLIGLDSKNAGFLAITPPRQKEIEKLKSEFEGSLLAQLQNVRSCQNNSKELYEAQIRNLKEMVDQREHEM